MLQGKKNYLLLFLFSRKILKVTHDDTKFCNGIKFSFGQFVFFFVILSSLLLSLKCVSNDDHGGAKEVHICTLDDLK